MRTLLTGLALTTLFASALSGPVEVRPTRYAETVLLGSDGSAVIDVRVLAAAGATTGDSLVLPYASSVWPDSIVAGGPVSQVVSRSLHGRLQAVVVLAAPVSERDTIRLRYFEHAYSSFGAPSGEDFGNYVITYRAVQPLPDPIEEFVVTMVLPPGFVTNNVLSSTPAPKTNSASSPYVLGMKDGRHCVTLRASPVLQGDVVALKLEVKRRGSSTVLIAALAIIACVYLIAFRDLVIPSLSKDRNHGAAL
jgi:hypothetical protein